MEELIAQLEMRNDEIWELLEDPTLSPLDRQELDEEIDTLHNQIIELEHRLAGRVVLYRFVEEHETIGADEYDREGWIANDDFDLSGET